MKVKKLKIEDRIKILERKVDKIIEKLDSEYSNLEMGYSWSDEIEKEYCDCGNKLVTDEEKREQICKDCK